MIICKYCQEILTQNEEDDCMYECGKCHNAFMALRETHRNQLVVEQDILAAKLKAESPQECPHCKGTGRKV